MNWFLKWCAARAEQRLVIDLIVTRENLDEAEAAYRAERTNERADEIIELRQRLAALQVEQEAMAAQKRGLDNAAHP